MSEPTKTVANTPEEEFVEAYDMHEEKENEMNLTSKDIAKLYSLLKVYKEEVLTTYKQEQEAFDVEEVKYQLLDEFSRSLYEYLETGYLKVRNQDGSEFLHPQMLKFLKTQFDYISEEIATKAHHQGITEGERRGVARERERIAKELKEVYMADDDGEYIQIAARVALFIKNLEALTPDNQ